MGHGVLAKHNLSKTEKEHDLVVFIMVVFGSIW
jgi:hypothetical protein